MKYQFNEIANLYASSILMESMSSEPLTLQKDSKNEKIELDRETAQKILDALSMALGDETSEDAEGVINTTKDVLKKGTYAGGGALAGNYVGNALGGTVGGIAGGVIGAGLGARAAR